MGYLNLLLFLKVVDLVIMFSCCIIKVQKRYAVQVSDTTMMLQGTIAGNPKKS